MAGGDSELGVEFIFANRRELSKPPGLGTTYLRTQLMATPILLHIL